MPTMPNLGRLEEEGNVALPSTLQCGMWYGVDRLGLEVKLPQAVAKIARSM